MKTRIGPFTSVFIALAVLGVGFIVLPVLATLLSTPLDTLGMSLADAEIAQSISTTFTAALAATLIGLLIGVPLAYVLARFSFPFKEFIEAVLLLPIIIPHTAAGIALLLVFGSQGLLGQFFARFSIYFVDRLGGTILAMLFVGLPFLVTNCREAFELVDVEMEKVALIDGANSLQAFFLVTLPQAWRGVTSGALMMWARGISEFGAVVILAYHPKVVPVLLLERFQGYGLKAAQPVAVVLIVSVLVVYGVLRWVSSLNEKKQETGSDTRD
ncbi:MAG: ABC transporter permease [Chloroflexi bacterium]|nr:ABC transporter permease [Chloroflexota bacterium]